MHNSYHLWTVILNKHLICFKQKLVGHQEDNSYRQYGSKWEKRKIKGSFYSKEVLKSIWADSLRFQTLGTVLCGSQLSPLSSQFYSLGSRPTSCQWNFRGPITFHFVIFFLFLFLVYASSISVDIDFSRNLCISLGTGIHLNRQISSP